MTLFFSLYMLLPADEKAVLIEICGQSKKSKSLLSVFPFT